VCYPPPNTVCGVRPCVGCHNCLFNILALTLPIRRRCASTATWGRFIQCWQEPAWHGQEHLEHLTGVSWTLKVYLKPRQTLCDIYFAQSQNICKR
jgi:hypothetical protein